ncbi:Possible divergent polysaccharide deacetylase [Olavius algarvensis Delta 1 endosymbiont]|nr:Possible divergent polysaccharide deacetylase [Olavius algarvensis Delta 1 endosymbiont]
MAKRKPTRKKKVSKKPRKKKRFDKSLQKAFVALAGLFVLVVLAGVTARWLIAPAKPLQPRSVPVKTAPAAKRPIDKIPTFEIYPKKESLPEKKLIKPPAVGKKRLPLVAIIIDDLGYDKKIAEQFSSLQAEITFSILPHSPFQERITRLSRDQGLEVMLHLPMEPMEYPAVDPGPGTLLTSMTPDQLIHQLKENLKAVPDAKGVNNHMGSKMTAESNQLYQIFSILKKKGLYFIDSRTSPQTICKPSARLLQIPFAQRDVFLDNRQEARFIREQVKKLIAIARRNGYAIGIGHPYAATYDVLREMLPEIQKEVQLVPASKIANYLG